MTDKSEYFERLSVANAAYEQAPTKLDQDAAYAALLALLDEEIDLWTDQQIAGQVHEAFRKAEQIMSENRTYLLPNEWAERADRWADRIIQLRGTAMAPNYYRMVENTYLTREMYASMNREELTDFYMTSHKDAILRDLIEIAKRRDIEDP